MYRLYYIFYTITLYKLYIFRVKQPNNSIQVIASRRKCVMALKRKWQLLMAKMESIYEGTFLYRAASHIAHSTGIRVVVVVRLYDDKILHQVNLRLHENLLSCLQ